MQPTYRQKQLGKAKFKVGDSVFSYGSGGEVVTVTEVCRLVGPLGHECITIKTGQDRRGHTHAGPEEYFQKAVTK